MCFVESGWEGIRTPGRLSPTAVFKTAALDHSATHPAFGPFCQHRSRVLGRRNANQPTPLDTHHPHERWLAWCWLQGRCGPQVYRELACLQSGRCHLKRPQSLPRRYQRRLGRHSERRTCRRDRNSNNGTLVTWLFRCEIVKSRNDGVRHQRALYSRFRAFDLSR
jgi:hypothetical protein